MLQNLHKQCPQGLSKSERPNNNILEHNALRCIQEGLSCWAWMAIALYIILLQRQQAPWGKGWGNQDILFPRMTNPVRCKRGLDRLPVVATSMVRLLSNDRPPFHAGCWPCRFEINQMLSEQKPGGWQMGCLPFEMQTSPVQCQLLDSSVTGQLTAAEQAAEGYQLMVTGAESLSN